MKRLLVLVVLIIVLLGGFFLWWNNGLMAVDPQDKSAKMFVVQQGKGVRELANQLKKEGLIRDPVVFFLLVKQLGLDNKIQAGAFRLSPSMRAADIAENLTHGTLDIWVTIPEGKRAGEIAEILKEKIPTYSDDWRGKLALEEGYLFPDTYLFPRDADISTIISIMKNNFDQKYATVPPPTTRLSKEEIVTLASLIEREAITDEEKPVIAGILHNRLNAGMALQVDATIQYAKGQNGTTKKWWEPVLVAEYKSVASPYNTYLSPGLPPGPIANPGIAAIKAAAVPVDTEYVYYLHDKNGVIRYAKTLDGHNANISRYGL